jgi:hypothetical protein
MYVFVFSRIGLSLYANIHCSIYIHSRIHSYTHIVGIVDATCHIGNSRIHSHAYIYTDMRVYIYTYTTGCVNNINRYIYIYIYIKLLLADMAVHTYIQLHIQCSQRDQKMRSIVSKPFSQIWSLVPSSRHVARYVRVLELHVLAYIYIYIYIYYILQCTCAQIVHNFDDHKSSKMAHFVLKCNKEDYLS